uniref:Uncharacterized protein n=1 Tax=Arundo donax TaxID=35708 RepID=A0A0A9ASG0_ARUDO
MLAVLSIPPGIIKCSFIYVSSICAVSCPSMSDTLLDLEGPSTYQRTSKGRRNKLVV